MGKCLSAKLETTLQSTWGMGFGGLSIQLGFIMLPAGGCYVEDESLSCTINRKTSITITNKDNNRFCRAVLASYNIGDRKTRLNEYDRPNVKSNASELCIQCDCEFNTRVEFTELPSIEEI